MLYENSELLFNHANKGFIHLIKSLSEHSIILITQMGEVY